MINAAKRTRMRRELRADNRWPGAFEPRERGFGAIDATNYVTEEISSAVHEPGILPQTDQPERQTVVRCDMRQRSEIRRKNHQELRDAPLDLAKPS